MIEQNSTINPAILIRSTSELTISTSRNGSNMDLNIIEEMPSFGGSRKRESSK